MLVFAALGAVMFLVALRRGARMAAGSCWRIGLMILSMTQAFAGSLYGPFVFALLIALPCLRWDSSVARVTSLNPARLTTWTLRPARPRPLRP